MRQVFRIFPAVMLLMVVLPWQSWAEVVDDVYRPAKEAAPAKAKVETEAEAETKTESAEPITVDVVSDAEFTDLLEQPDTTRQRELKRIEAYLNSLSTVVSDFTQVAPDGSLASGKFYLKRPGQMRWQYEPPTPVLIIADKWHFTYYDYELEQVTQLPVESSLASILARKKINLSDPELVIEELVTSPGAARIKIHQKDKKEEGSLLLEMADQPLKIRNIVVTDAQGQTTTISLNKARFGMPLEKSLFIWKDPRKKRR